MILELNGLEKVYKMTPHKIPLWDLLLPKQMSFCTSTIYTKGSFNLLIKYSLQHAKYNYASIQTNNKKRCKKRRKIRKTNFEHISVCPIESLRFKLRKGLK